MTKLFHDYYNKQSAELLPDL